MYSQRDALRLEVEDELNDVYGKVRCRDEHEAPPTGNASWTFAEAHTCSIDSDFSSSDPGWQAFPTDLSRSRWCWAGID